MRVFDQGGALSLAEIARAAGIDRAAARRLVLSLVEEGYVHQSGRLFALAPRCLAFGAGYLRGAAVGTQIQPVLNRFAAELGGAITLAVPDGMQAIYIAQSALPDSAVSFGFTIGSHLPLLHTAAGRMMLAYGAPDWAETALRDAPLMAHTPASLTTRDAIGADVARARASGAAVVVGEFEPGVTGFAVPLGNPGALRAVLGTSRMSSEPADGIVDGLQRAALTLDRMGALQR